MTRNARGDEEDPHATMNNSEPKTKRDPYYAYVRDIPKYKLLATVILVLGIVLLVVVLIAAVNHH